MDEACTSQAQWGRKPGIAWSFRDDVAARMRGAGPETQQKTVRRGLESAIWKPTTLQIGRICDGRLRTTRNPVKRA
jgi:hypothetical protein